MKSVLTSRQGIAIPFQKRRMAKSIVRNIDDQPSIIRTDRTVAEAISTITVIIGKWLAGNVRRPGFPEMAGMLLATGATRYFTFGRIFPKGNPHTINGAPQKGKYHQFHQKNAKHNSKIGEMTISVNRD